MKDFELFFVLDSVTEELIAVTDDYDVAISYSEVDFNYHIVNCVVNSLKICLYRNEFIINLS